MLTSFADRDGRVLTGLENHAVIEEARDRREIRSRIEDDTTFSQMSHPFHGFQGQSVVEGCECVFATPSDTASATPGNGWCILSRHTKPADPNNSNRSTWQRLKSRAISRPSKAAAGTGGGDEQQPVEPRNLDGLFDVGNAVGQVQDSLRVLTWLAAGESSPRGSTASMGRAHEAGKKPRSPSGSGRSSVRCSRRAWRWDKFIDMPTWSNSAPSPMDLRNDVHSATAF